MRKLFLILVWTAPVSGCSLVLNWDPAGLACDTKLNNQCAQGYSCLVDTCIADASLSEGETCLLNQQCAVGLFCPPQLNTCRASCSPDHGYAKDPKCPIDDYCKPVRLQPTSPWQFACVPSDCKATTDCQANLPPQDGNICVKVSDRASACFHTCSVAVAGPNYSDSGCTGSEPHVCQPMGLPGDQQLVCMPGASSGGGRPGKFCDPVITPCASSNACVATQCYQYCTISTSGCTCCPCAGANVGYGICVTGGVGCPNC